MNWYRSGVTKLGIVTAVILFSAATALGLSPLVIGPHVYHVPETVPRMFTDWSEGCLGDTTYITPRGRVLGHVHVYVSLDGEEVVYMFFRYEKGGSRPFAIFYKLGDKEMVTIDYDGDRRFETVMENLPYRRGSRSR